MFNAARVVARPVIAASVATASAGVASGSAQARAPPPQGAARQPPAHAKLVDRDMEGWLLTELQDEVVLFKPYNEQEVDDAAETVMSLWTGRPLAMSHAFAVEHDGEEAGPSSARSNSNSVSSDGAQADDVIEAVAAVRRHDEQQQLSTLMSITTRMLRRPGMQREVVKAMLEDEDVRDLMMRNCSDIDRYLMAAGIHAPGLLTPPPEGQQPQEESAGPGADPTGAAARAGGRGAEGPSLVSRLVGAVAGALDRAGGALAFLGGWLRDRLAFMMPFEAEEAEAEEVLGAAGAASSSAAGGREGAPKRRTDQILGGVMMLAVAVFCVAIIRRPLVLRAMRRA